MKLIDIFQQLDKSSLNEAHSHDEDCDLCNGTGEGLYDGESCPKCHGTGVLPHQHSDDDFDVPDDDFGDYDEPESHYEKYVRTRGLEEQGVAEASIPYALSAANYNAEFERQHKNRTSSIPAGGGYRGRVELDVESKEDYIATGRALKKAAEAAGQHIEYGLSGGVMKVFSDSMTTDELDTFIDDTLENFDQGVAEGSEERGQNRLWQMITDYEQRAKATKNDIKKSHYLKMASELRSKLKTSDEQGVAETRVGNRMSDMTVGSPKIVHKNGRAVGEIGVDHDPSPGQGPYYMKHYETNTWYSGYATKKEALDDLKHVVDQMNEGGQKPGEDYIDPPEADYGDEYQDMVSRVKKLAGLGPLKTVYDPEKRVYKNVPTAEQPKK